MHIFIIKGQIARHRVFYHRSVNQWAVRGNTYNYIKIIFFSALVISAQYIIFVPTEKSNVVLSSKGLNNIIARRDTGGNIQWNTTFFQIFHKNPQRFLSHNPVPFFLEKEKEASSDIFHNIFQQLENLLFYSQIFCNKAVDVLVYSELGSLFLLF